MAAGDGIKKRKLVHSKELSKFHHFFKDSTQELIEFLREHKVMTLATTGRRGAHAAPVFYALTEDPFQLIFLSDPKTRHVKEMVSESRVAAGVYLETEKIGLIRGAQLWGEANIQEDSSEPAAVYFKKFPQARIYHLAHPGHRFCTLKVEKARLIDNRFGFGKNQEWDFKKDRK